MKQQPASFALSNLVNGIAEISLDAALTVLEADDAYYAVFGVSRETYALHGHSLRYFLPGDVGDAFYSALTKNFPRHSVFQWTLPNDGACTWLHVTALPAEPNGPKNEERICRLVVTDITAMKGLQRQAVFESWKYEVISEISKDIFFEYDFAEDTMVYTEKYRTLFGEDPVLPGFRHQAGHDAAGSDGVSAAIEAAARQARNAPRDILLQTRDGGFCWFSVFCTVVKNAEGSPLKAIGMLRDIDAQKREQLRLLDKSRTDAMTGLYNKGATEEEVRAALPAVRPDALGVLMMIDIDDFKVINDTMGHPAGDTVLLRIVQELRAHFRREDVLGRVGGDEFLVYMCDVADVAFAEEKVRLFCNAVGALFQGRTGGAVAVSAGLAVAEKPLAYEELYRRADIALYRAKSWGKNRYAFFERRNATPAGAKTPADRPSAMLPADNGIATDIVDILFGGQDGQAGIKEALAFIGNTFRVDGIAFFETSLDGAAADLTYYWRGDAAPKGWTTCRKFPADRLPLPAGRDVNGIFYCADTETLPPQERTVLRDAAVSSLLLCDIARGGEILGCVCFMEYGGKRLWTRQEVNTLLLTSKLLGEHIHRKRTAHRQHISREDTHNILDNLPSVHIYVIDSRDFSVLYCNDAARRRLPAMAPGVPCHRAVAGFDVQCPRCPLRDMGDAGSVSAVLRHTPLGPMTDIRAFRTLWEDGRSAYVVMASEHIATDGEKDRFRREEQFSRAVCATCEHVVLIDPEKNRYEFFAADAALLRNLPRQGPYDTYLHAERHFADPASRRHYLRLFSLKNMRASFAQDTRKIQMNYQVAQDDGPRWKQRQAFPLPPVDGSSEIIVCVRDITEKKKEKLRRIREEKNFYQALRNSYAEMYRLHLASGRFTVMFRDAEVGRADADEGPHLPTGRVHPDDRSRCAALYDPAAIRKFLASGAGEISGEYRIRALSGRWRWMSSVIVPVTGGKVFQDTVLVLVKDVTRKKEQEQRQRVAEQYAVALRKIYDGMYELNVTRNTYRMVCHVPGKYAALPESGLLHQGVVAFADNIVHPEDKNRFLRFCDPDAMNAVFASGRESDIGEFRIKREDGDFHWVSITVFPVRAPAHEDKKYLCFIMDIAAKKRAEEIAQQHMLLERRRLSDERCKAIVEQTDALVFEWCRAPERRYISPEIPRRFAGNYNGRDLLDVWRDDDVILPKDRPAFKAFLETVNSGRASAEMTARFRRRDGGELWCKVAVTCRRNTSGELVRIIGTLSDVDAAARSLERLKYQVECDTLTGLYNMRGFYTHSADLLRRHKDRRYSIIRMDINRFKVVNDLYGIEEGDKLLRHVADLLRERVFPWEVCGRLSGDVFCACVGHTGTQIRIFMHSIMEKLAKYPLPHRIVLSFGICKVEDNATPVNVLCDWANLALKTIKGSYIRHYAFYDEKLREKILEEKNIENAMHDALKNEQFVVYLQPKVDIATSRIVGAECLVRWRQDDGDVMPPDRFIPQFEKNGFIITLDEYVWEESCRLLRSWMDSGHPPVPLSVNVSRMHIHNTDFCGKLLSLCRRYSLEPRLLELELTESAFLENADELYEAMKNLQHHGFLFSMDDFGTGYSSLNMLKSLPIDTIKIDRGFFDEDVSTERGKIVIRHTIAMATQMRMRIVAEGVETVEQAAFLLGLGCCTAQGYYYSEPLPAADFEKLAFAEKSPFAVPPEIARLVSSPMI